MLNVFKVTTLLSYLAYVLAVTNNSCRNCNGNQLLIFNTRVSRDTATNYFKASLGDCATGKDYVIQDVLTADCTAPCLTEGPDGKCAVSGPAVCGAYTYILAIYRYCGNGKGVLVNKGFQCKTGTCATTDTLTLTCNRSVECRGPCNKKVCGVK